MKQIADNPSLAMATTPRWTIRSLLLGILLTVCVYMLLPFLEMLSLQPDDTTMVRDISTINLPPPPPVKKRRVETKKPQTKRPKPQLQKMKQQVIPLQAALDMTMNVGDFAIPMNLAEPVIANVIENLVFDIADLDEPPHPLARLSPIYPTKARMRRIEGHVVLEFIVTPEGCTKDVNVVSSQPGTLFVDAAKAAVQRWRFQPGTKDGEVVAARVRQKVKFQLN